jgi:hypothetical protein
MSIENSYYNGIFIANDGEVDAFVKNVQHAKNCVSIGCKQYGVDKSTLKLSVKYKVRGY